MTKVLIVDGTNIAVRAARATARRMLQADGVPTGALLAFATSLGNHIAEQEADRVVVCWDPPEGGSDARRAVFEGYKANRPAQGSTRDEDIATIALIDKFCRLVGVETTMWPGYEADDLVAAYWRATLALVPERTVILSGDADLLQLVDDRTFQVRPGVTPELWGPGEVRLKYGCEPHHLPLLKAVMGDASDGIKGVPGYGPKKSLKCLQEAGWDLGAIQDPRVASHDAEIRRNLGLVNLRVASRGLHVGPVPTFTPEPPGEDTVAFLEQLQLIGLLGRLETGSLWGRRYAHGQILPTA